MLTLSSIFQEANNQAEKERDVLVLIEDETLYDEKTTEADWGNNTAESNVDYTIQPGQVKLDELTVWVIDFATDKVYEIKTDGTLVSSFATSVFDASATTTTSISYAPDGTLWITDQNTDKIYNVSTTGTLISSFATSVFDASSVTPTGISYALDGTLWITDSNTQKAYNVSTTGTLISSFSISGPDDISYASDGTLWILDSLLNKIYNVSTTGTLISSFDISVFGAAPNSVHALSYASDNTLWTISSSATTVYNLSTKGGIISSFSESIFDVAATLSHGISSNVFKYPVSGIIVTDNLDIGEVPTSIGEWALSDIKPPGTTLTYTAKYSTTGAWGGEEVSIGAIVDGDAITVLARYWRVTATLSANTARNLSPTLQSIKADYSTYRRFNRIPDLGYESIVQDVSSLTSKVDFFNPASIGQISVSMEMTSAISDWVYSDTLYNKIIEVKLGFKYPGFVEADYIHYFTGAIDDWNVDDQILNLTLKDLSKEWKLPVPSKWETDGDDRIWSTKHHVDVMLDIFQNDINVRDSGLLLDSFATVKAATSGYAVTRTITGTTEDAKKLVEELRVLLFAFFIPRGDGKISIKQFDSAEAAATTFTDDNTVSIKWQANSKDMINKTSLYFGWDTLGEDEESFESYDEGNDTTSQTNFQEIKPYILKDKWTTTISASQIADLEAKILDQFDNMPSIVTITCDAKDIAYGSGGAGITDEKYLITSKNLDFLGDRIVFKGLRVA
jgi:streptogramin lyase